MQYVTVFSCFNRQMARSMAIGVLLLSGPLNADAQQGVLSFRGQVVNPTCEVDTSRVVQSVEQRLHLQVRPGLVVEVSRASNACKARVLPFSTHFQPLASPDSQRVSESAGVLTVTYQ